MNIKKTHLSGKSGGVSDWLKKKLKTTQAAVNATPHIN